MDNGCRLGMPAAGIVGTTMTLGIGITRITMATIAVGMDGIPPGITVTIVRGIMDITDIMVHVGMVERCVLLLTVAV